MGCHKVKPGKTLVLLLIGHGGVVHDGEFQFLVTVRIGHIASWHITFFFSFLFLLFDITDTCTICVDNIVSDSW